MVYLLLRILFTVSFSHLLRLSQARTRWPLGAALVNYAVAAVACGAWAALARHGWHARTAMIGGMAGFTYVSSLLLILPSMHRSGVSLTGAVVQLSLMLPVGVSIWRFGEYPNRLQWGGIGLTLVALPLLSAASAVETHEERRGFSPLTLLLFLSTGASQVFMKEFSATCPAAGLALYTAALFAAATFFTGFWILLARDRPSEAEAAEAGDRRNFSVWGVGLAMGAVNLAQLVFLLLALATLRAVIVFPLSAALGIAANVLASMLFWGERPPPAGWIGISLAIAAVALLTQQ
jgi:multidrug transporter EmrE-like cation transporter